MTHAIHTVQAITIIGNLLAVVGATYAWRLWKRL